MFHHLAKAVFVEVTETFNLEKAKTLLLPMLVNVGRFFKRIDISFKRFRRDTLVFVIALLIAIGAIGRSAYSQQETVDAVNTQSNLNSVIQTLAVQPEENPFLAEIKNASIRKP